LKTTRNETTPPLITIRGENTFLEISHGMKNTILENLKT